MGTSQAPDCLGRLSGRRTLCFTTQQGTESRGERCERSYRSHTNIHIHTLTCIHTQCITHIHTHAHSKIHINTCTCTMHTPSCHDYLLNDHVVRLITKATSPSLRKQSTWANARSFVICVPFFSSSCPPLHSFVVHGPFHFSRTFHLWHPFHDYFVSSTHRFVRVTINNDTIQIDVTYYPFDTQMCELKFASWTTEVTRVGAQMNKKALFEKPNTDKSMQPAS